MEPAVRPIAWQPLTPGGLAAFATAALSRVLLVQLVMALAVGGTLAWFLHQDWWPVISAAVRQLPQQGQIRGGQLDWTSDSPLLLAEGRFLALAVDLTHAGNARSPAHVEIELGQHDLKVFSLFGYCQVPYPRGYLIACNRAQLVPWWGAWSPALLALAVAGSVVGLMVMWAVLACIYCPLVWLVGFFANRALSWSGSWKVAAAALVPGALFMALALVVYGLGGLDPVRLMIALGLHLVIGWGYLVAAPFRLPFHPEAEPVKKNPFHNG